MDKGNTRELWEYVLTQIELSVSSANFNTWFRNSFIVKIGEDGVVYIGVPSQFFKDWYLKKFHSLLLKIVRDVSYEFRNIEYLIVKDDHRKTTKEAKNVVRNALECACPLLALPESSIASTAPAGLKKGIMQGLSCCGVLKGAHISILFRTTKA